MAGVPWYYDESRQAYRVRHGFKFPGFEISKQVAVPPKPQQQPKPQPAITQVLKDGETLMVSLKQFLKSLQRLAPDKPD